jgi:membrane-bound metal-dependent hydrolase YbcI (DUF457 family)
MFVGHYGVSFAAKARARQIPLWVFFLAVQFLDVVWAPLILLGIEKVRIVPGFTATNPLDLYYMPYTHSLIAALSWSALAYALARIAWRYADRAGALVLAGAVFSHWVLDFIVHRPDLPLYDNTAKVGLGLWNLPAVALALEVALLFGGMSLYFRNAGLVRRAPIVAFGVVMLAIQVYVFFGPPPASGTAAAATALICYAAFAAIIAWLERRPGERARGAEM